MSGSEDGLGRTGPSPNVCVWLVAFGLMGDALTSVMAAHLARLFSEALRNNNSAPCAISSSYPAHLDSC